MKKWGFFFSLFLLKKWCECYQFLKSFCKSKLHDLLRVMSNVIASTLTISTQGERTCLTVRYFSLILVSTKGERTSLTIRYFSLMWALYFVFLVAVAAARPPSCFILTSYAMDNPPSITSYSKSMKSYLFVRAYLIC